MENTPEMKFKAGAVSATIWKNSQTTGEKQFDFYTISLGRNYKDKTGTWKTASSMRLNDLPKAKLVLDKAYEFLTLREENA